MAHELMVIEPAVPVGSMGAEGCHNPQFRPSRYTAMCPCCEGVHTKAISKGRSEEGIPMRAYRCLDCAWETCLDCADLSHRFSTFEQTLPRGLTLEQFDSDRRDRAREWWRQKHGYAGMTPGRRTTARFDLKAKFAVYDRKARHVAAEFATRLHPNTDTALRAVVEEAA